MNYHDRTLPSALRSYDAVMASRDPAFLWETEALRTSSSPLPSKGRHVAPGQRSDWMTLRQASDAAGIPLSRIRTWVKKGRVPTALEELPEGTRRIVSLDAVRARARQLDEPELSAESFPLAEAEQEGLTPPPGTMLVPIAAWDKMLMQLGNLHKAGQELAEARERAARAETEATFLRERLAELRQTTKTPEPVSEPVAAAIEDEPAPLVEEEASAPQRMPRFSAYLWRLVVSDRRRT
jgi:hypothetical protein